MLLLMLLLFCCVLSCVEKDGLDVECDVEEEKVWKEELELCCVKKCCGGDV